MSGPETRKRAVATLPPAPVGCEVPAPASQGLAMDLLLPVPMSASGSATSRVIMGLG